MANAIHAQLESYAEKRDPTYQGALETFIEILAGEPLDAESAAFAQPLQVARGALSFVKNDKGRAEDKIEFTGLLRFKINHNRMRAV